MKIFGILVMIISFAWIGVSIKNIINGDERLYCGTIKYKVGDVKQAKYRVYTDNIFVVVFNATETESGFIQEMHPNWNVFLSKEVGDTVCYNLVHPDRPDMAGWIGLMIIFMFIGLMGYICYTTN